MKNVPIIGCYNSMASTIFGPMDILNQAVRLWDEKCRPLMSVFFFPKIMLPLWLLRPRRG
ncbi:MAG: hypothetical protein KAQ72_06940 [Desulfobacula sp.]|nr:hypothetical protein [Desulfobacula sp.]